MLNARNHQYIHLTTTELNAGQVANGLMGGSLFFAFLLLPRVQ